MEWMILPLKRYAQFNGRSRRKEFWMWVLFQVLVGFALGIVDAVLGLGGHATGTTIAAPGNVGAYGNLRGGILSNIFSLAVLVPNIAVSVRRMHDTNRSGWWILLPMIPLAIAFAATLGGAASGNLAVTAVGGIAALAGFVCAILVLVWYCTAGTIGPNRFGNDPKADIPADLARTFE
jgi:uncharacterized membrane protein YhaH (DUF805 family)